MNIGGLRVAESGCAAVVSGSPLQAVKAAVAAPVKLLTRTSPRLNAASWDAQYQLGLWDRLDQGLAGGGEILRLVAERVPQPRILDLGCGTTANLPLEPGKYQHYHGVDISAKAIERARALRRPRVTLETADILGYQPREPYDAILLREVVYYLPAGRIGGLLRRLSGSLTPEGVILVQVWPGEDSPRLAAEIDGALPLVLKKTLEADDFQSTVYLLGQPAGQPAT